MSGWFHTYLTPAVRIEGGPLPIGATRAVPGPVLAPTSSNRQAASAITTQANSESEVNWFLKSFEEVQMHKFPGPAWDVISDIGKMVVTNRAR